MRTKLYIILIISTAIIIATDIMHTMGRSYVSSAVPAYVISLYLYIRSEKKNENDEGETNERKHCSKCMKWIRKCICACGNWE